MEHETPIAARRVVIAVALALAIGAVLGCARAVPRDRATAALYRDLQRVVSLSEAAGWQIDRIEIDELLPEALMSVCYVDPSRRARLLAWLDLRIEQLGGDVEQAWRKRGKKLDAVEELLEATRVRMVLARADEAAPRDCPFWAEPDPGFRGRQIADDRWQLSFGGGGKAIVSHRGGDTDLSAGGAGRFMFGRAFGDRFSALVGLEAGGSASFPKESAVEGERGNLVLGLDVVVPAVIRYRLVNTYLELEAGYLRHYTEEETDGVSGMKLGVAFGGRAARRNWFLPGAVFGVSYERTFPDADQGDPLTLIKLGFRVAVDVDL